MFRTIGLLLIVFWGCSIFVNAQKRTLNFGIINKKAIYLPKPIFPRGCRCKGVIKVRILIDVLSGKVIDAKSFVGNPLLRASAVIAARQARFTPLSYSGKPLIAKGILIYNFN